MSGRPSPSKRLTDLEGADIVRWCHEHQDSYVENSVRQVCHRFLTRIIGCATSRRSSFVGTRARVPSKFLRTSRTVIYPVAGHLRDGAVIAQFLSPSAIYGQDRSA